MIEMGRWWVELGGKGYSLLSEALAGAIDLLLAQFNVGMGYLVAVDIIYVV